MTLRITKMGKSKNAGTPTNDLTTLRLFIFSALDSYVEVVYQYKIIVGTPIFQLVCRAITPALINSKQ